jgi:hypothetical protein
MKKFAVLSLISFLILAFGATVYGQEKAPALEFKASGFVDAITFWYQNVTAGNGASGIYGSWGVAGNLDAGGATKDLDRSVGYLESRGRLKFDAIMGKEMSGTFYFEVDSSRWGDVPGGQIGVISDRGKMGYWGNADRAAVEVKNVYLDFGVPFIPVPTTVRVGLQGIGIRPALLLSADGMAVNVGIKIDPVLINPIWAKANENKDYASDDSDLYILHANAKVGTLTVGGYGLYFNQNTYPNFASSVYITGAGGETISSTVPGTMRADFWWFGFYTDGKVGPLNLNFDFIYDKGKVKSRLTPGTPDVKYNGWATMLHLAFPWEKFAFGGKFMYATGADLNKTDKTGLPNGTNTKVGSYVVPTGSESGGGFGESIAFYSTGINRGDTGIANNANYTQANRGGIGGTWMAKLYADFNATPEFKLTFQGLYIGDTAKHGNTFGTALKADGVTCRDDGDIGIEADVIATFKIYKNLTYTIGGGYLWAGDAMDLWNAATGTNFTPKNPWQVTSNLTYSF